MLPWLPNDKLLAMELKTYYQIKHILYHLKCKHISKINRFFPYDIYEASYNGLFFGAISINTAISVQEDDNLFIIGREREFL